MKNLSRIFIIPLLTIGLFLSTVFGVGATYVTELSPAVVNNDANINITVSGFGFTPGLKVFVGDYMMEDVQVVSSTLIKASVPQGMTPGLYDLRVVPKEGVQTVFPDSVTVYGNNVDLVLESYEENQIAGGIQMKVAFNKEVRIKGLSGATDTELRTVIRKPYSKEHFVPFSVDLENNLRYYVFRMEAKDLDGQEIVKTGVYKISRSGVINTEDVKVEYMFPNIKFNDNSADLSFKTNVPVDVKVERKLFRDNPWLPDQETDEFTKMHELTLGDLVDGEMYYIRLSGTSENGKQTFEEVFKFQFSKISTIGIIDSEDGLEIDVDVNSGLTADDIDGNMTISTMEKLWSLFEENRSLEDKEIRKIEDEEIDDLISEGQSDTTARQAGQEGAEGQSGNVSEIQQYDYEEFNNEEFSRFIPEVKELVESGVIIGDEGMFHPRRAVTRAEFATLICRASGYNLEDSKAYFIDVASSHMAFDCLSRLVEDKIIRGTGNGNFNPDDTITRGEAMTILTRAFDIEPAEEFKDVFADLGEDYELWPNVVAAYEEGWIIGDTFRPRDSLKRVEAFNLIAVTYGFADSIEVTDFGKEIEAEGTEGQSTKVAEVQSEEEEESTGEEESQSDKVTELQSEGEEEELGLDEELLKLLENLV